MAAILSRIGWAAVNGMLLLGPVLAIVRCRTLHPGFKVWLSRLVFIKLVVGLCFLSTVTIQSAPSVRDLSGPVVSAELVAFLALMWLVGVSVVWSHLVTSTRDVNTLRRVASPLSSATVAHMVSEYGVPVDLRESAGIPEPCVVGAVRPCLILPKDWQFERGIIAHELAHVRHRDLVWNYFGIGAYTVSLCIPGLGRLMKEQALWQEAWADHLARDQERVSPSVQAARLLTAIQRSSSDSWARVGFVGTAGQVSRRIDAMFQSRHSLALAIFVGVVCVANAVPLKLTHESATRARLADGRAFVRVMATRAN